MFFEKELLAFNILDVLFLKQGEVNMSNGSRNFNALSYRFRSDAVLTTKSGAQRLGDRFISFVPARLDYTRSAGVDEMIVVHFDTTNYVAKDIECFEAKNAEVFERLFGQILDCWEKKPIGYKYKCTALLYEIFGECYLQNFKPKAEQSKIQASFDFILNNYKNPKLSIKELADRSFMSEVYFRKLFKKKYGVSPQRFIIKLRMQNAAGLISTGYYSLKEVALMSGYEDYKYFSVEFKKTTGVSPSKYLYNYEG